MSILMIGIMLVSLPTAPSLLITTSGTETHASRAHILRDILQHNQNFRKVSKRSEEVVEVPYRIECCPAETNLIQPKGGISREGKIVELYRNYRIVQTFYQTSCKPEVEDRPCSLIDEKVRHLSQCVQKYSYVYAFMKDFNVSESYRLDYLRVKSGCSCQLQFTYPEVIAFPSDTGLGDEEA